MAGSGCPGQTARAPECPVEHAPGVPRARSFTSNSPPGTTGRAMWCWLLGLQRPHVGGLGALGPRRHVELDHLPLSERAVAGRLDRAEMHEDVLAGLLRDEAVALVGVEPLHGSNRHVLVPPSTVL